MICQGESVCAARRVRACGASRAAWGGADGLTGCLGKSGRVRYSSLQFWGCFLRHAVRVERLVPSGAGLTG